MPEHEAPTGQFDDLEEQLEDLASSVGSIRNRLRGLHRGIASVRDELGARQNKIGFRTTTTARKGEGNER